MHQVVPILRVSASPATHEALGILTQTDKGSAFAICTF
jgi:hypothetical protein